jgi:hypothetical protein
MRRRRQQPVEGGQVGGSAQLAGQLERTVSPPKTISRMASAAMMPATTDGPGLARSEFVIDAPPRDTWTLAPSAVCAAAIRACASAAVTSAGCASQMTRAKATVPFRLTCAAPAAVYGLITDVIPGSAETLASAAVTALRTGGESMAAPPVAWMTT